MVEKSSEALDSSYAALSHAIRRDILARLARGPARVTGLAAPYPMSLAAVSKHIHLLEAAHLVERTVQGRDHVIAARPQGLDAAGEWITVYRSFWESRLDALDSVLRERAPS
ncbi:MAG TPA: helix-turn-helix domain-containing protein [Candidatus Dormibacteraeota bacterium]